MASLQMSNQDDGKDGKELDSTKQTPSSPLVVEAIISIQESSSSSRRQPWPKSYSYWGFLVLSSLSSVVGGIAGSILLRFYFVHGGSRKWVNACVQTAAWPINLVLILILRYCRQKRPSVWSGGTSAMTFKVAGTYVAIGCIVACDNFLYSWGLAYLPLSTSTILFSTQLAFNSVFAYFLVGQRFTPFILNSVILETIAGVLLGVHAQSDIPQGTTHTQYVMGFIVTIVASAIYGLILCLLEVTFSKVVGKANFLTVIETLTYISAVATAISLGGMWINGDFRAIVREAQAFDAGPSAYAMTLVFTAVSWQAFWLDGFPSDHRELVGRHFVVVSMELFHSQDLQWHASYFEDGVGCGLFDCQKTCEEDLLYLFNVVPPICGEGAPQTSTPYRFIGVTSVSKWYFLRCQLWMLNCLHMCSKA